MISSGMTFTVGILQKWHRRLSPMRAAKSTGSRQVMARGGEGALIWAKANLDSIKLPRSS